MKALYLVPVFLFVYALSQADGFVERAILWPGIAFLVIRHLQTQLNYRRANKALRRWQSDQKDRELEKKYESDVRARAREQGLAQLREAPPPIAESIALIPTDNEGASIIFDRATLLASPIVNEDIKAWVHQTPDNDLDVCIVPTLWHPFFEDIVRLSFEDKTCVIQCEQCQKTYFPHQLLRRTSHQSETYACPINHDVISIVSSGDVVWDGVTYTKKKRGLRRSDAETGYARARTLVERDLVIGAISLVAIGAWYGYEAITTAELPLQAPLSFSEKIKAKVDQERKR